MERLIGAVETGSPARLLADDEVTRLEEEEAERKRKLREQGLDPETDS